jgi:hypothetical protein
MGLEIEDALPACLTMVFFALCGILVYFTYVHATTHHRTAWLWTIIACVPIFGPLAYFIYSSYKLRRVGRSYQEYRRELKGEYLLKPHTIGKRLKEEAAATLRKFRDRELEGLILGGHNEEAYKKLVGRRNEAIAKGDTAALETYYVYSQLMNRYDMDEIASELDELTKGTEEESEEKDVQPL